MVGLTLCSPKASSQWSPTAPLLVGLPTDAGPILVPRSPQIHRLDHTELSLKWDAPLTGAGLVEWFELEIHMPPNVVSFRRIPGGSLEESIHTQAQQGSIQARVRAIVGGAKSQWSEWAESGLKAHNCHHNCYRYQDNVAHTAPTLRLYLHLDRADTCS